MSEIRKTAVALFTGATIQLAFVYSITSSGPSRWLWVTLAVLAIAFGLIQIFVPGTPKREVYLPTKVQRHESLFRANM